MEALLYLFLVIIGASLGLFFVSSMAEDFCEDVVARRISFSIFIFFAICSAVMINSGITL